MRREIGNRSARRLLRVRIAVSCTRRPLAYYMDGFSDTDDEDILRASEALEKRADMHIPEKFEFPFEPYDIQTRFMRGVFEVLELGKIGIFESPTGTGKSLSLICGTLTWLFDYERRQEEELAKALSISTCATTSVPVKNGTSADSCTPDWITQFALQKKTEKTLQHVQAEHTQRVKVKKRLEAVKNSLNQDILRKRQLPTDSKSCASAGPAAEEGGSRTGASGRLHKMDESNRDSGDLCGDKLDDNLVADYESDQDSKGNQGDSDEECTTGGDADGDVHVTKIFYCSRTHSQLSQFVREVQRSPFGSRVKLASIGSRQTMCINDSVRRLASLTLINDKCMELRKTKDITPTDAEHDEGTATKKKKKADRCPFYSLRGVAALSDQMLVEVQDIEELVDSGRQIKACPYYAARKGIAAAQLVVLPYNVLLHKSTRESSGIQLKGNVVVIDEAHNLLDAISSIHRSGVTGNQLCLARSQLMQYQSRYRSRLKAKNLFYVQQLVTILTQLIKSLSRCSSVLGSGSATTPSVAGERNAPEVRLTAVNDFLFDSGLDNVNFFKVLRYCRVSGIANKLLGFVSVACPTARPSSQGASRERGMTELLHKLSSGVGGSSHSVDEDGPADAAQGSSGQLGEEAEPLQRSPLRAIENFLQVLTNASKDGRVVITCHASTASSSLQYLLLNPATYFVDVLEEARAVIVAGGTMQPISDFKEHLFLACRGISPERIMEYSCGHIMPPENLLAVALAPATHEGHGGLELTFSNRGLPSTLDCISQAVLQCCQTVPGGVVCFLPSYEYETAVYEHMEKSGTLRSIAAIKKVFREPKKASMVDAALAEYAKCIANADKAYPPRVNQLTGAVLFSVVGGKMSEGINFSDDLGRCVIMVGLPYPNLHSPELREKMRYLDVTVPQPPGKKSSGSRYYENMCVKAVNQSIGRAIRHRNDYAAIVLLDARYHRDVIIGQLPAWVSQSLHKETSITGMALSMSMFFAKKTKRPV